MNNQLSNTFVEVWELLLPPKAVMDTYPEDAQGRLYNLAFLIVGLLTGSRISASQIQSLIDKLPEVKPGESGGLADESTETASPTDTEEVSEAKPSVSPKQPKKFSV